MRRIAIFAVFVLLTGFAMAAGSDEQYLDIYNEILQGDSLQQNGHPDMAAQRYLQAQTDLQKLSTDHPTWNPDIVKYRLDYLADKLQALAKYLPNTNNAPPTTPAPTAPTNPAAAPAQPAAGAEEAVVAALQQQNAAYQEQIRSLTAANTDLQSKLKEALSVQPTVTPEQLAKAQEQIVALQKERDLLAVTLDQEKAAHAADLAAAKQAADESQKKLDAATKELEDLKAARATETDQAAAAKARAEDQFNHLKDANAESAKILEEVGKELELLKTARPPEAQVSEAAKPIGEEGDQLKQALAQVSKDEAEIAQLKAEMADGQQKLDAATSQLEALKTAPPGTTVPASASDIAKERDQLKDELAQRSKELADAEARHNEELLSVRTALQQAEQKRDELEKKLAAAPGETNAAPAGENPKLAQEVEQLQARIAVLEASPVPYTRDELALFKNGPPPQAAAADTTPAPPPQVSPKHMHSIKDLPPGAGQLWEEAMHASMAGDYQTAEQKYNEVLKQDETNVYVLAFLANVQFAAGQLDDCEKTVERALAVDPEDPGSLYLLGLLRYRQNKLDEALDALSLSAKYNPTNPATENFLGCVLADKGLRPAAETALRKALQNDPDYAEAHFNLAVVYAGNQPPSLELARWHYKRALALGHPKSAALEKLLTDENKPGDAAPSNAPAPAPAPDAPPPTSAPAPSQ